MAKCQYLDMYCSVTNACIIIDDSCSCGTNIAGFSVQPPVTHCLEREVIGAGRFLGIQPPVTHCPEREVIGTVRSSAPPGHHDQRSALCH